MDSFQIASCSHGRSKLSCSGLSCIQILAFISKKSTITMLKKVQFPVRSVRSRRDSVSRTTPIRTTHTWTQLKKTRQGTHFSRTRTRNAYAHMETGLKGNILKVQNIINTKSFENEYSFNYYVLEWQMYPQNNHCFISTRTISLHYHTIF